MPRNSPFAETVIYIIINSDNFVSILAEVDRSMKSPEPGVEPRPHLFGQSFEHQRE